MIENRDTFFARLQTLPWSAVLSEDEIDRIELTYDLAKNAHRGQTRKDGERYFEHPRRATLTVLDDLVIVEARVVMDALLHDTYEDCARYLKPSKIRIVSGPDVARDIRLLSKVPKEGSFDRLMLHAEWQPLVVKGCDRLDNLRGLAHMDDAFKLKQLRETSETYLPLFRRLTEYDAPMRYRPACEKLYNLLVQAYNATAITIGVAAQPDFQGVVP
ncbi:MAG: HD domain-containing protein [Patescibacteria group bacterium]|jgi:GTP pyrophosphokinase